MAKPKVRQYAGDIRMWRIASNGDRIPVIPEPSDPQGNQPIEVNAKTFSYEAGDEIKVGDGVVFDEGHPEQDEQGGRVASVIAIQNGAGSQTRGLGASPKNWPSKKEKTWAGRPSHDSATTPSPPPRSVRSPSRQ